MNMDAFGYLCMFLAKLDACLGYVVLDVFRWLGELCVLFLQCTILGKNKTGIGKDMK